MDPRRWRWMVQVTGADSTRGMAKELGVTHPTVGRWLSKGIPVRVLADLVCKHNLDALEAWMVWGLIGPEHVEDMNWAALAQYMPMDVLVAELHRRETHYVKSWADPLRRQATGELRLDQV